MTICQKYAALYILTYKHPENSERERRPEEPDREADAEPSSRSLRAAGKSGASVWNISTTADRRQMKEKTQNKSVRNAHILLAGYWIYKVLNGGNVLTTTLSVLGMENRSAVNDARRKKALPSMVKRKVYSLSMPSFSTVGRRR